jgi:prepilin-type N-terminal cleavage/methylation domain-containing protein
MARRGGPGDRGFTLVEMLIVVTIIGVALTGVLALVIGNIGASRTAKSVANNQTVLTSAANILSEAPYVACRRASLNSSAVNPAVAATIRASYEQYLKLNIDLPTTPVDWVDALRVVKVEFAVPPPNPGGSYGFADGQCYVVYESDFPNPKDQFDCSENDPGNFNPYCINANALVAQRVIVEVRAADGKGTEIAEVVKRP